MTYQCPHCSRPITGNEAFCPNCGGRLTMAGGTARSPEPTMGLAPAVTEKKAGGRTVLVVLVVLGVLAITYFGSRFLNTGGTPNVPNIPVAADVPPSGQIWFGSSFDTSTFAIRGRTSTTTQGSVIAYVAHLPKAISSGDANIRIALDSTTLINQALDLQGFGDVFGSTYTVPPLAGTYTFTITDLGGNTLASGAVAAR